MQTIVPRNDRHRPGSNSGYTLIEAVLLLAVLAVIAMPTSYVIVQSMTVYARTTPLLNASYQTSLAVERIRRDVRDMPSTPAITAFSPTALSFVDAGGAPIAYAMTGGDLTRNGDALARGVTAFAFTYRRRDGAPAAVPGDLHVVEVDIVVQSADQESHVLAAAFPRAFGP